MPDSLETIMYRKAGLLDETAPVEIEDSLPAAGESTAPLTEAEIERFALARAGIVSNEK